jgi:L-ascorbate metabolism protein UlaG (beta-lactamase superfamily)
MKITWLGQSGYIFESESTRLLLDPFYSDVVEHRFGFKRLQYPNIPIEDLRPDGILITHDHIDHFDPISLPIIHRNYPDIPVIGPQSVVDMAKKHDFNSTVLRLMAPGDSTNLGSFRITATIAHHSDPFSLGFIIQAEQKNIYYSGDTLYDENLYGDIASLTTEKINTVFIVINGKLGNMNVEEAVHLTSRIKPDLAIPMHYGMFTENTENPELFVQGLAEHHIHSMAPEPGKTYTI